MNTESMQETLFQDPIGMRLRQAREKCGLAVGQVAQQLKLPVAIVEAMERDDWQRLGAPVYVRSYLGSYLRLVGLPADLAEQAARTKATPALITMGSGSRMRHTLNRSVRNLVYLVMTAVLVIPVVLVARHYQTGSPPETLTLEPTVPAAPTPDLATGPIMGEDASPIAESMPVPPAINEGPAPVMASMAPFAPAADAQAGLLLKFRSESWVDVVDAQGVRLERGLVAGGVQRRYAPGQVAHITLGNADGVEVSYAGRAVDLMPYRAANVARFAVSSTGEPATAGN